MGKRISTDGKNPAEEDDERGVDQITDHGHQDIRENGKDKKETKERLGIEELKEASRIPDSIEELAVNYDNDQYEYRFCIRRIIEQFVIGFILVLIGIIIALLLL